MLEERILGTASDAEVARRLDRTVRSLKSPRKSLKSPAWREILAWAQGSGRRGKTVAQSRGRANKRNEYRSLDGWLLRR